MEVGFLNSGGRLISTASDEGKELMKWEKPYRYEPFPKMLYMANKRPDGVVSVGEAVDSLVRVPGEPERAGAAEQFNARCQLTVQNEDEMRRALDRGWRNSPQAALDRFEEKERAIGQAAAERAHADRDMSEPARAEAAAVEASTSEHIAEVPEKKRGRPRKVA